MKKAVVVLPTYNESQSIAKLIDSVFEHTKNITNWEVSVLVVDSNSPDNTAKVVTQIAQTNSKVNLLQTPKEGLGMAYVKGFKHAITTLNADLCFEMDADFSHDPKDIPEFLHQIDNGADFVIGTRYSKGGSIPSNWGLHRKILSVSANWIIRLGFLRLKYTEWTNGYRAITKDVILKITPQMTNFTGYVFQVAFLDKTINAGFKVAEVPVNFTDRVHGKSKINAKQYIFQTLLYVINNSSFIKFAVVGLAGAIVDFGLAAILKYALNFTITLANIISAETSIVSNFLLNNYWSFKDKRATSKKHLIQNFFKFNLISLGNIVIQVLGINLLSGALGPKYWIIYKALVIGFVVIPYSYVLYNKIIWKKKQ